MRAVICSLLLAAANLLVAQERFVGTTMNFTDYLEKRCGIVFTEEGIPTDPYQSMANHGANMVRLTVSLPPFSSSYSEGELVDHHAREQVKIGMQRASEAGLNTLLTFTYRSYALEDEDHQNIYVAPLAWQEIALDLDKITDSVYKHTYAVLDAYCGEGLFPSIVSIGNESTWHRLMPNVPEDQLPAYDPARSVAIHNAGSMAVRDIAVKYDTLIKVAFHMTGPATTRWWLETHWPYEPDMDMMGISLYHGWNKGDYGGYASLGEYVSAIIETYGIEFLVMETAQLFTSGGNDSHVDILGPDNIPPAYDNPPTPETQRQYLIDITREVFEHGGSGVLVWGGEWVACDCYIYADQWGKGSSWENKAFWDFEYDLQDGVNWMMAFSGKVPINFKVDMEGTDTSKGVFLRGDFENFRGERWAYNRMHPEGNNIFQYTVYMEPGDSASFFYLNDTIPSAAEMIPAQCREGEENVRTYLIPPNSQGEILAYRWSDCDTLIQYALAVSTSGEGTVAPVKGIYSSGIPVTLSATPAEGWLFSGWTGDSSSTQNPFIFPIQRDMELVANFSKKPDVPVSFKVDMNGVDVSKGVYVTGEFPNRQGETWQLNPMTHEKHQIYRYDTWISTGSSGAYYFLNENKWGIRESVPSQCAVHWGVDRGYEIPLQSSGETFAFVWSSCEEIGPLALPQHQDQANMPLYGFYPNPLNDNQLILTFYVNDMADISILDLQGRRLIRSELPVHAGQVHTFNLHGLHAGVYLIRIRFHKQDLSESELFIIPPNH